ncbi:MAG: glycosyl hydrolase 115 family protein, partial [Kiritimatiellae bacterium]|nr:glycosyl hydrolase 115 family protein [Kiritimatiellia bacterium]
MRLATATILLVSALAVNADGVKYRGIFVNDEDWSLRPWAVKHFGKKEQIGTRAYEEIFSLMEKDGLNLIWPAMHEGGYEFSSRPENLELARKHGIVVGTSHCEPMLRNNCYLPKEDKKKWSWTANRDFLVDYWKEGVRRGTGFSNRVERVDRVEDILWTIGMRGIHDGKMQDGKTTEEKIKILEEVFAAQCAMLPEGAAKLFVPYKEVLPIFNAGLKVPKDATIMWTNDNFGYVRRVGGPQCQGYGGGIYWHASYHGSPHGYIHLCTTPPAFMWYELVAKCWENGVRDVWMVNAGDVFQAEILLDA